MKKSRVLIVDDSPQTRKSLRDILEKNNNEIVGEAGSGIEAIQQNNLLSPDIIMLDIIMPQFGGLETLRMLRSLKKDLKIIMVSALNSMDRVNECLNAGANSYLLKPFQEKKVLDIINQVLTK